MVSGRGFSACLGGDALIVVPGLGGWELLAVDLEEVVGGAHESPLTCRGVESSHGESAEPEVGFDVPEDCLDSGFAFGVDSGTVFGGEPFNHCLADLDRIGETAAMVLEEFAGSGGRYPHFGRGCCDGDLSSVEAFNDLSTLSQTWIIGVGDTPG